MGDRDDYCDACGTRFDDCTCDARRELRDALEEALGRGTRPGVTADQMRERAVALGQRLLTAMRTHVEQGPDCPHCARCTDLFSNLMTAQRGCEDIITSLDTLAYMAGPSSIRVEGKMSNLLGQAARRCFATLNEIRKWFCSL
jgi:hypothetical protein